MLFLILSIFFFFIICAGFSILLFKIAKDSIKENDNWGINFRLPNCPNCGQKVPAIRKPTSTRQALWGGWTCSSCNCEMNKWGKEIQKDTEIENTQQQIKQLQQDFINLSMKKEEHL